MNVSASLRTALRALRKNKLRSRLAMLGIVIAVGAVVATVAIGQGAQAKVAAQMASLGSNLLMIVPGSMMTRGAATGAGATQTLTRDDGQTIERELASSVAAIAPINRTGAQVVYGDQNWFTQVVGTTAAYLEVRGWPLAEGSSCQPSRQIRRTRPSLSASRTTQRRRPADSLGGGPPSRSSAGCA